MSDPPPPDVPEPPPLDTPLKLDLPTQRPTQAFLDDRERQYRDWPNTVALTTCIELLRFKNRVRGEKGANKHQIKDIIYWTLKPIFPDDLTTMAQIVTHFALFDMPSFDRFLDKLSKCTGHDCLLFVYDSIAVGDVRRCLDAEGMIEIPRMKQLSFGQMQITVRVIANHHRDFMAHTGNPLPSTQLCRRGDAGDDLCFPVYEQFWAHYRDRNAVMQSLGLENTEPNRDLVMDWMEAGF